MKPVQTKYVSMFFACVILLSGACTNDESADIHRGPQRSIPVIDVWYGEKQIFGSPGTSQQWINILGNISDPDEVDRLSFSLNGESDAWLSMGPDGRRLAADGDFNIEIVSDKLKVGLNNVVIHVLNTKGEQISKEVAVEYWKNIWPLPYTIDWASVSNIQQAVQIVDGLWILGREGIRTHPDRVGYDRVIAVGDMSWRDYEVTVPVTIHGIDASAYGSRTSKGPAFGINLRWTGHTDMPVKCSQPHCGWKPFGGSFWYKFRKGNDNGWRIIAGSTGVSTDIIDCVIKQGRMYWLKVRVVTGTYGDLYQFKVWEDGKEEPSAWMLETMDPKPIVSHGSFLLVAHHVDMTFGKVTVVPVNRD